MSLRFKYIYGPVESWRMGKSLGIDPLSDSAKICNLNCVYCQLGKTPFLTNERREYVPTEEIIEEIRQFFETTNSQDLPITKDIDYLTFSGRGEPTLAKNLGEMIQRVRKIRPEEIAVITNSTLMYFDEVQQNLSLADFVIAKLDAYDETSFLTVDQGYSYASFEKTLQGIKSFKKSYEGTLALQVMFVKENQPFARQIADVIRDVNPDEIQINTPLRPSAAKPLNKEEIEKIKSYFRDMPMVSVYDHERKETLPIDERQTIKRHGNYKS